MKKLKAFSIIELLVVIAIIGVLAAIAVPAYQQYSIRAATTNVIVQFQKVAQDLAATYDKTGAYPLTYSFNGVSMATVNPSGYAVVNQGAIGDMSISISPDKKGLVIVGYMNGSPFTKILGYVFTHNSAYVNNGIAFSIRDFNGTMKTACGQFGSIYNGQYIPLSYLPAGCQCTDNVNFYTNGTTGVNGC